MIVKNEESVLDRCLKNIAGVFDEIIIVDTGSTDKTKQIAKKYTNKIFNFKWINDFSAARNYSFSKATSKYIMWLDADDIVTTENIKKLKQLKPTLATSKTHCFMLKYAVAFSNNQTTFVYYRERILKNHSGFVWQDPVHEVITPKGNVEHLDIVIEHRKTKPNSPERNLKIYEANIKKGVKLSPRQQFYYARELYYNSKTEKSIEEFIKFLDNNLGWIENKIEAHLMLAKCYKSVNKLSLSNQTLVKSFSLDLPRAEILCELASNYIALKDYKKAIYWLKLALKIKPDLKSGAFVLPECYNSTPNLLLCVCYYNLGRIKTAENYNNKVLKTNPKNQYALSNKQFFENQKNK